MATTPGARLNTISYPKGTVTAVRGLLEYLFGNLEDNLAWAQPVSLPDLVTGRRRRKYGTRQRGSARAGEAMKILLSTGKVYTVRITGTHTAFIDFFLSKGQVKKVANIYSERGSIYGPQIKTVELV